MKMLLTSAGIKNKSLSNALNALLGKPISECNALAITTASHVMPNGPEMAYRFITGQSTTPMCELGWKSVGVLELTALPSIDKERWVRNVEESDVLLVNGGDPLFLNYWMLQSGLADLLPSLNDHVYVGLSAGSMIMAPNIGDDFVKWRQPSGTDETLGVIDFAIFPHLDHVKLPDNDMAGAEKWAATMVIPCYAIDDETGIQVVDGKIDVISEGHWRLFPR